MQFIISAPDGTESIVNGVDELKRLRREGRIAPNILVRRIDDPQWYPLNEMFNLALWDDLTPLAPPAPSYVPPNITESAAGYYGAGPSAPPLETPSIRGMRAAGCLMIAAAVINIGMVTLRGYHPTTGLFAEMGSGLFVGVSVVDIIVGMALFNGRWRPYAMFRVCMAALVYGGQVLAFQQHTLQETLTMFFQLVFIAGFIILLSDQFISLVRTLIGVGTSVFAQVAVGVVALIFMLPALKHSADATQIEKQFKPYVIQNRHFTDTEAGVTIDLPDSWVLVQNDNPLTNVKKARMVAVDLRDLTYATFRLEYVPPGSDIESVDDYLSAIEENVQKNSTDYKEISRVPSNFGNQSGIRAETSRKADKVGIHAWRSVCRRGDVYYMLSGWCTEGRQAEGFPKYKELEQRFTLTTFPDAK